MNEQFNLFGNRKTQVINKNPNPNQEYNLFKSIKISNDNSLNNNKSIKNQLNDFNQKEENKIKNNNININLNKKNLNPKTFNKKQDLKASINFNLISDENDLVDTNSNTNNKNEININNINNIEIKKRPNYSKKINININNNNQNNSNKIQVKNNYNNKNNKELNNKDNKDINNKDNNNNEIKINDKKSSLKEKNNLYKSMIFFNESEKEKEKEREKKMKMKEEKEISFKKKRENEKNKAEIIDKLKCYICMDKIKKPRMCKYCHRPACANCLQNWLNMKHQCAFCRKKINFNETIDVPIFNDIAEFFIKNINHEKKEINKNKEKKEKNENNNIFESKMDSNYTQIISAKLNLEENICQKHKKKYEYFCCQCNEKCCDKCLIFLNESSKIHQNHLIVPLEKMEKKDSQFNLVMEEFDKFYQTNLELDNVIKSCELKIRELEIEKNNFTEEIDIIKGEIKRKLKNILFNINSNSENIMSKNEEFNNSIDTTPMALKNIISLNDYGQGQQIYKHLSNLNKYASFDYLINLPERNLYIETFISNPIEITISEEGNINLDNNEQINNLIPHYEIKLEFDNIANNITLRIKLKKIIDNNLENEKILCFAIIRNKKYECEFVKMKQEINEQKEIQLFSNISTNAFFSFRDENNKISFKLYFMVYKS